MLIKEGVDIIDITIIGTNCSNGHKLAKMVFRAVSEIDKKIQVQECNDYNKYGISNIPGLVIDGKIVSQGKILSVREIKKLLI